MQNPRYAQIKEVRSPHQFENNHTKTPAQLYGKEYDNHKQLANPTNKIGYGIAMNENFNYTQNKTNLFTDPLYIQSRPIGVRGKTYVGLKTVRPPPNDGNAYKWAFTPADSTLKAPFSSYNLPRDRTIQQYIGV